MTHQMHGFVTDFDETLAYGFVSGSTDDRKYFFHCTRIVDGSRSIAVGTPVSFGIAPGHCGQWEAVDIAPFLGKAPTDTTTDTTSTSAEMFPCLVCSAIVVGSVCSYEICPNCGWEDDPVSRSAPSYVGGANGESLEEAKARFASRSSQI